MPRKQSAGRKQKSKATKRVARRNRKAEPRASSTPKGPVETHTKTFPVKVDFPKPEVHHEKKEPIEPPAWLKVERDDDPLVMIIYSNGGELCHKLARLSAVRRI